MAGNQRLVKLFLSCSQSNFRLMGLITHKMSVNISLKPFVFGINGTLLGHLGVTPKYYSLKTIP